MSTYAPFAADTEEKLRSIGWEIVYSVVAYPVTGEPIELDVENLSVTFDERQIPYIQSDFECKVPEDQVTLDRLDPRKNCRVIITVGYIFGGVEVDAHDMADLHLRTRSVDRPSNLIKFTATSDEARAIDRKRMSFDALPPKTGLNEVVTHAVSKAVYPDTAEIVSTFPPGYRADLLTELTLASGDDYAKLIEDVMNRTNTWITCEGDRRWRISSRPTVTGVSALKLMVGAESTIHSSSTVLEREQYANAVQLRYVWKDTNDIERTIIGEAYVSSNGAHGVDAIGWLVYVQERSGPVTKFQADSSAAAVLAYKLTLGRTIQLEAIAAFWLRPGMTVTVQLPTGEQERHLVTSVSFTPLEGRMVIKTRQPENVTITTGG